MVFADAGYSVASKAAYTMFVNRSNTPANVQVFVVVVIAYWREKRLKITHQIKWKSKLFIMSTEFKGTFIFVLRIGIFI